LGLGFFSIATDVYKNVYLFGEVEDTDFGNFPMNTCGLQETYAGAEDWLFLNSVQMENVFALLTWRYC